MATWFDDLERPIEANLMDARRHELLISDFCARLIAQNWRRAADHACGKGMESGVHFGLTVRSKAHFKSDATNFTLWMQLVSGGILTEQVRSENRMGESPVCRRCGLADESVRHMIYECSCNRLIEDPVIDETAYLIEEAAASDYDCLYARGIVPMDLLPELPASAALENWRVSGPMPDAFSEAGVFFTDASGGPYTGFLDLLRVAAAAAAFDWVVHSRLAIWDPPSSLDLVPEHGPGGCDDDGRWLRYVVPHSVGEPPLSWARGVSVSSDGVTQRWIARADCSPFGLFAETSDCIVAIQAVALAQLVQSIPAGELLAVTRVVESVACSPIEVWIFTDSLVTLNGCAAGPLGQHADGTAALWERFWLACRARASTTHLCWIRSHVDKPKPGLEWWRQHSLLTYGNSVADWAADNLAASEIQLPFAIAGGVLKLAKTARDVQQRALRFATHC